MEASRGPSTTGVDSLSGDIWKAVFRYLSVFQLKKVRLTCHAWRRIVDVSRLLSDQLAFIIRCEDLDRDFAPHCRLPVHSVLIFTSNFINVNHWWPDLGANLSHLYLRLCHLSLPMIAGMLRQTPNLNNLGLKDIFLLPPVAWNGTAVNFRLEKLSHFSLSNIPDPLAKLMRRLICPRLKCFGCAWDVSAPQDDEQLIIDFIRDSQDTLKTTRLTPTVDILAGISSLNRLQLQDVTFWCNPDQIEHVLNFTRKQASIEKLSLLDLALPELVVLQICANLPALKHLTVNLDYVPIWQPSSLFELAPNLEYLKVNIMGFAKFATHDNYREYRTKTVGDFRDCIAPRLREINLTDIYPSTNLQSFLRQCPNLHTVLLDLACDDFPSLTSTLPLGQLRTLTLRSLTILTPWPSNLGPYENLRRLALYHVRTSKATLTQMLTACPNLEVLTLCWIAGDDQVRLVCERFARLKQLELHQCPITDRSVDALLEARVLELLTVHGCYGLSRTGRARLQNTAKFRFVEC